MRGHYNGYCLIAAALVNKKSINGKNEIDRNNNYIPQLELIKINEWFVLHVEM